MQPVTPQVICLCVTSGLQIFLYYILNIKKLIKRHISSFLFCRYESIYSKRLPESILGEIFLEKYSDHNDSVTVIDPKRSYGVTAPTRHPIYENFRVKVSRLAT